jgi:hypothetical protein
MEDLSFAILDVLESDRLTLEQIYERLRKHEEYQKLTFTLVQVQSTLWQLKAEEEVDKEDQDEKVVWFKVRNENDLGFGKFLTSKELVVA